MEKNKLKELRTLVVRIAVIGVIALVVYFGYQIVKEYTNSREVKIEDSPLRVEQIRSIVELNTLRFQDEVVVDTIEHYTSSTDHLAGTLEKILSFQQFSDGISGSLIKRRLSLVVQGELLYGVNLKIHDFDLKEQNDTLVLTLPEPELISATVNPSGTDVFVETGTWSDYARRVMLNKAKKKMIASGERMHLKDRAKEPLVRLIKQLVHSEQPIKIEFK